MMAKPGIATPVRSRRISEVRVRPSARAVARGLACSLDSLAFDDRTDPSHPGLRIQLAALDRLDSDQQEHVPDL